MRAWQAGGKAAHCCADSLVSPSYLEAVKEVKSLEAYAGMVPHHSVEQDGSCRVEVVRKNSLLPCLDHSACCKGQKVYKVGRGRPEMAVQAEESLMIQPELIVELREGGC